MFETDFNECRLYHIDSILMDLNKKQKKIFITLKFKLVIYCT
jgi:hypothetical protein